MQKKKQKKLFNIVVIGEHKARKTYLCPDGVISPGQFYWRGFAICNGVEPFEFFFTNDDFVENEYIPDSYLVESLKRYRAGKHKLP